MPFPDSAWSGAPPGARYFVCALHPGLATLTRGYMSSAPSGAEHPSHGIHTRSRGMPGHCRIWPRRGQRKQPGVSVASPGLHVLRPFRGRTSQPRHTHAITRHARTLPHLAPEGTEKIARGEPSEPRDSCHKSNRAPAGAPEELVRIDTLVCATGRCKGTRLCYIFRQELTFDPGGVSCRQSPKRS